MLRVSWRSFGKASAAGQVRGSWVIKTPQSIRSPHSWLLGLWVVTLDGSARCGPIHRTLTGFYPSCFSLCSEKNRYRIFLLPVAQVVWVGLLLFSFKKWEEWSLKVYAKGKISLSGLILCLILSSGSFARLLAGCRTLKPLCWDKYNNVLGWIQLGLELSNLLMAQPTLYIWCSFSSCFAEAAASRWRYLHSSFPDRTPRKGPKYMERHLCLLVCCFLSVQVPKVQKCSSRLRQRVYAPYLFLAIIFLHTGCSVFCVCGVAVWQGPASES